MEKPSIITNKQEIIDEINKVRTDPASYAIKIKKYISYFKGNNILRIPNKIPIKTNEGPVAFEEAVKFLMKVNPVSALTKSIGLNIASRESLTEIQKTEDPSSLDNQNIDSILDRVGEIEGQFAQSVDFGSSSAELVVVNLIVDDGDSTRGNRNNLINSHFRYIGAASDDHSTYHNCTVIMFARTFNDKEGITEENFEYTKKPEIKKKQKNESEELNDDINNKININNKSESEIETNILKDANEAEGNLNAKENPNLEEETKTTESNLNNTNQQLSKEKGHELGANKILSRVNAIEKNLKNTSLNQKEEKDEDFDLPPGVNRIERSEKLIVENGINKKIVKLTKHMEDGTIETETFKELVK